MEIEIDKVVLLENHGSMLGYGMYIDGDPEMETSDIEELIEHMGDKIRNKFRSLKWQKKS